MAKVRTRTLNWDGLVRKADPKKDKPEVVYQFSNGRKFVSTDRSENGIYKRP